MVDVAQPSAAPAGEYAPKKEENDFAMWAHIAPPLVSVIFGGMGWIVPLVIWLMKKDTSKYVSFHALQSLFLQIAVFVLAIPLICTGIFLFFPLLLVPALFIGTLIYGIMTGIKAGKGEWVEYWVVGKFARDIVFKPGA